MLPTLSRRITIAYIAHHRNNIDQSHKQILLLLTSPMETQDDNTLNANMSSSGALPQEGQSRRRLTLQIPRTRNADGLLELKASTTKTKDEDSYGKSVGMRHRRTQSLKIPILINSAKHGYAEAQCVGDGTSVGKKDAKQRQRREKEEREEKELEYLQKNTFIGTASLDTFLSLLDLDHDHEPPSPQAHNTTSTPTTTLHKITKTFSLLSSTERNTERPYSHSHSHSHHLYPDPDPESHPESHPDLESYLEASWDLVPHIDPTNPNTDYVSRARIKLGSISLGEFLGYVESLAAAADGGSAGGDGVSGGSGVDDEESIRVPVMVVVKAFEVASRRDMEFGEGEGVKARAFRRWMVGKRYCGEMDD